MIDKFYYDFLNRVYGYDDYTQLEINSKLIQKIDEVIEECNSAFEFVDWLKEQGVPDEVQTIINAMHEDGTLEKLINAKILNQFKTEITNNINQLTTETENKVNQMKTTMNNRIEETVELVNQSKNELDGLMNNFEEQTGNLIEEFKNDVNIELKDIKTIKVCVNIEQFKNAVEEAKQKPTIIYLAQGEYILTDIIFIPNNTEIVGLGEVIIKAKNINCCFCNYTTGFASGYNGTKNITIRNITFDGENNNTGLTLVGIGHAENVTIENCTFKNLQKWHMIEFNAVRWGHIKNCKFDNYGTSGSDGTEAIQLDSMISSEQFPWHGIYDGVANKSIIIEGNYFTNVGVKCIGGHSFKEGSIQKDIIINNNTFETVHTAININDFDGLIVTNNNSRSCRYFLVSENVKNPCVNLTVSGNTHVGYYVNSTEGLGDERFIGLNMQNNQTNYRIEHVSITNNNISCCAGHSIGCTANYVSISNNKIYNIARHGIYFYGGLCGSIVGNTFKDTGKESDRYSIAIGNNSGETAKGVMVTANSVANLRGILVGSNVEKCNVSNNASPVQNNASSNCTTENNVAIG